MPGAGDLDRRVTLQTLTVAADDFGGPVQTWTELATVWARRVDVLDAERFAAGAVTAPRRTRWVVRWSAATAQLRPQDRLVAAGLVYAIDGIRETADGRGRFLELSTALDLSTT